MKKITREEAIKRLSEGLKVAAKTSEWEDDFYKEDDIEYHESDGWDDIEFSYDDEIEERMKSIYDSLNHEEKSYMFCLADVDAKNGDFFQVLPILGR
jgi:hypothetical protein